MNKKQKNKGKKKIVIWSIVGVIMIAVISLLAFSPRGNGDFQEEVAVKGDITTYYSFSGTVEAKNRQSIASHKEMHIEKVHVKEGEKVKKGDVLLKNGFGEEIKAEIDGEVSKVYVKENSHVLPGDQLIDVVNFTDLQTNVKVDEYDLKYLKVNKEVKVTINALEKEVKGRITAISKEATNENGVSYFIATIDLAKDDALKIGMSAEAKVLKEEAKAVTTLPMDVIQFDSKNKPYVLLPSEKGLPTKKYITTGINDGLVIEVKNGITPGDVVVFTDNEKAQTAATMHGGM